MYGISIAMFPCKQKCEDEGKLNKNARRCSCTSQCLENSQHNFVIFFDALDKEMLYSYICVYMCMCVCYFCSKFASARSKNKCVIFIIVALFVTSDETV